MEDLSYLGCKWHPQAYDADVCENCVYDKECYARFLRSMNFFKENVPLNTFGKMAKTE